MTIRVLVADDHTVVRDGLSAVLGRLEGFEVVGEARDGEEAVKQVQLLRPDVALMDIRMPGVDGVEATRRIVAVAPATAVLMLTMYDDDATVLAAIRAGARGYLLKDAGHEEIATALRAVVAGQVVYGPAVAARMLAALTDPPRGPLPTPPPFPELTDRERSILELLAAGRRTGEIAAELYLSPKTVSNQLTTIFAKLGVTDRTGAVIRAREGGLGGPDPVPG
ncbi:response regulator [Nocardioides ultimimeridianus]